MNRSDAHYVYEAYDAEGQPLYVGATHNWAQRFSRHVRTAPWFADAITFQVTRYPDRASAMAAEKSRIRALDPVHNLRATPREVRVTRMPQRSPEDAARLSALRAARERASITCRQLAAQVGVSHQHLARIETGQRPLTPDLSQRIARAIAHRLAS